MIAFLRHVISQAGLLLNSLLLALNFAALYQQGRLTLGEPRRWVAAGELVLTLSLAALAVYNLFRPPPPPRE